MPIPPKSATQNPTHPFSVTQESTNPMSATLENHGGVEIQPDPLTSHRTAQHGQATGHDETRHGVAPGQPHTSQGVHGAPGQPHRPRKSMAGPLFLALVIALVIVGALLWKRSQTFHELAQPTADMAGPTVPVTKPTAGPATTEIQIPGKLNSFPEAPSH